MHIYLCAVMVLLGSFSCSHSKPKPEPEPRVNSSVATIPAIPAGGETTIAPKTSPSPVPATLNEYLNSLVLPQVVNSKVVHECFLDNPKSKPKELASGNLSYQFEIKLVANGNHVNVSQVYLSSIVHLPVWVEPCIIAGYKKFVFPPFPEAQAKSSTAFGTVTMSWKQN